MKWFRLYDDLLDDPKVQRLPPSLFKAWINILCLANKGELRGILPTMDDIAFRLRISDQEADPVLQSLQEFGLLDKTDAGYIPHDWIEQQQPENPYGRLDGAEWASLRLTVFQRDMYTCQYCGLAGIALECDHIVPISRGGSNDIENLTTACMRCNRSKGSKTLEEWEGKVNASK
jgi:hypothetical protein